jgi:hypothetical protein
LRGSCFQGDGTRLAKLELFDGERVRAIAAVPQPARPHAHVLDVRAGSAQAAVWLLLEVGGHAADQILAMRQVGPPLALKRDVVVPADDERDPWFMLGYLSDEVKVSNSISPSAVAATPTNAAWGSPSVSHVATTASPRCRTNSTSCTLSIDTSLCEVDRAGSGSGLMNLSKRYSFGRYRLDSHLLREADDDCLPRSWATNLQPATSPADPGARRDPSSSTRQPPRAGRRKSRSSLIPRCPPSGGDSSLRVRSPESGLDFVHRISRADRTALRWVHDRQAEALRGRPHTRVNG